MIFAILPNAYLEQTLAAGVAEAFGTIILVIFLTVVAKSTLERTSDFLWIGFMGGICVLASPGTAYSMVYVYLSVIVLMIARKLHWKKAILGLAITGVTTVIVSLPYFIPVIRNHGLDIFVRSFAGQHGTDSLITQFKYAISFQYLTTDNLFFVIGIVGFFILLRQNKPLVPFWFIAINLIPRESAWLIGPSAALMIGYGSEQIVSFLNGGFVFRDWQKLISTLLMSALLLGFVGGKLAYLYNYQKEYVQEQIDSLPTEAQLQLLETVKDISPEDAELIVLSTPDIIEWSPVLSERTVLNVRYGTEWDVAERETIRVFNEYISKNCQTIDCVADRTQYSFSTHNFYLIIDEGELENLTMTSDVYSVLEMAANDGLYVYFIEEPTN
jgi:energy-converting hydrogenase Eha subunit C